MQAQPLFSWVSLPGLSTQRPVPALRREPLYAPLRYRVIVLPGSGCAGLELLAERYFAGLLHAQVLVLHKPGVDPQAGAAPDACPKGFIQTDSLAQWLQEARAALRADAAERASAQPVPQVLVGISEGAEFLASLAPEVPHLAALVMLSGSGLDPWEAGQLQAQRLGQLPSWQALDALQRSDAPDHAESQGRSLRYWRDLWRWRAAQALIESPWPVLQAWGDADPLVPVQAYQRFAERAKGRSSAWCSHQFAGADHGLQAIGLDGVQRLWNWLENWAREPGATLCDHVPP